MIPGQQEGGGEGEERPDVEERLPPQYRPLPRERLDRPRRPQRQGEEGGGDLRQSHGRHRQHGEDPELPEEGDAHIPLRRRIEQVCKEGRHQNGENSTEQVHGFIPARHDRPCSGEQCCAGGKRHADPNMLPEHGPDVHLPRPGDISSLGHGEGRAGGIGHGWGGIPGLPALVRLVKQKGEELPEFRQKCGEERSAVLRFPAGSRAGRGFGEPAGQDEPEHEEGGEREGVDPPDRRDTRGSDEGSEGDGHRGEDAPRRRRQRDAEGIGPGEGAGPCEEKGGDEAEEGEGDPLSPDGVFRRSAEGDFRGVPPAFSGPIRFPRGVFRFDAFLHDGFGRPPIQTLRDGESAFDPLSRLMRTRRGRDLRPCPDYTGPPRRNRSHRAGGRRSENRRKERGTPTRPGPSHFREESERCVRGNGGGNRRQEWLGGSG